MRALPLGLTGNATMVRDVPADTILTYDDVDIDENLAAVTLRRECEAMLTGTTTDTRRRRDAAA